MAFAPFLTFRLTSCHCRNPRASPVPARNMSVRFRNDHLPLGTLAAGKVAIATASGISPDLNFSTMTLSACLTLSCIFFTSLLGAFKTQKPSGYEFQRAFPDSPEYELNSSPKSTTRRQQP